jgi:hypothetical protein
MYWANNFEQVMMHASLPVNQLTMKQLTDLTEAIRVTRLVTLVQNMTINKPVSPSSAVSSYNCELVEHMFMYNVAKLLDEEAFQLCMNCAELYPEEQVHLFVCDAYASSFG